MKELEKKRSDFVEVEKANIKSQKQYFEQIRKRFDYADTSQWIAEDKNQTDLIFITEKFSEWYAKATDKPEMLKLLNQMLETLFRVQSYINHIETVSKHSVALYTTESKANEKLLSEKKLLEYEIINMTAKHQKELESAKKEIEFITSNNGKS